MKQSLLCLAGLACLASIPAAAQQTANTYNGESTAMKSRIAQLETRLQDGIASGEIDRSEARSLRQQIQRLNRMEQQLSRNGLTQAERRQLQQQIRYTRDQLRLADGDAQYAGMTDDEYYDRYASKDNQTSRYQSVDQVCARTSGLAGILGAAFGNDNCLNVGEQATYGLTDMPQPYREEFPDTSTYYYRYLDGNVVQIDRKNRIVTQIYDVKG